MVILRAFLALLAGVAVMTLLVGVLTAQVTRLAPSWTGKEGKLPPGYAFVNLGCAFLSAAAGGYVTAWVAGTNPLVHVLALGVVVLALAALSTMQARATQQPIWYKLALVGISPVGVLAGGLVRLRVLGIM